MNGTDITFIILMAFSLSACAGLRAFLPPLAVSLLAIGGYVNLAPGFAWMADPLVAGAFGLAAVLELLGDKFPGVDNVLDSAGIVLRPLAGALLASSLITGMDPVVGLCLGIIVGAGTAGIVQAAKGGVRMLSTASTGGLANPLLSWIEDALAFMGTVLAIIAAPLAALLTALGIYWIVRKALSLRRRTQSPGPAA